ncbi:MAG: hypothetical protein ACMG57_04195 [Candidatus Dojkabacteria bacterium]
MAELYRELTEIKELLLSKEFEQPEFIKILESLTVALLEPSLAVRISEFFKSQLVSKNKYIEGRVVNNREVGFDTIADKVVEMYPGKRFIPMCLAAVYRSKDLSLAIEAKYTESALSKVAIRGNHYVPVSSTQEVLRQIKFSKSPDNVICLFYHSSHYEPITFLQEVCFYIIDEVNSTGDTSKYKIIQKIFNGDFSDLGIDLVLIEKET